MFDLSGQSEVKKKDKRSFSPISKFSPSISAGPRIDLLPRLRAQQGAVSTPKFNFIPSHVPSQVPQPDQNPIVGENLFLTNTFPIRQNDSPFFKGLKGIGNFGISTLSAPGEMLRRGALEGGSLLSGNGLQELPKNTSFTQDILPKGASNAINNFQQSNPIIGGIANMALETAVDPTSYITGNTFKNLIRPQAELGMAGLTPYKMPKPEATPQGQQAWNDVQNAYRTPINLRDARAQQLNTTFSDTTNNLGRTGPTLPRQGMTPDELLQNKQVNAQGAFGGPREIKQYGVTRSEDKALAELQDGIKAAQEFLGSNKLVNDFAGEGFTNAAAMDNIKHYTGIDLPELLSNWERTQKVRGPLTETERIMGRKAGVIPPLKQREGFPIQQNLESPLPRALPEKPSPLQWTNRETPQIESPLPIRSITSENVGQLPGRQLPFGPRAAVAPIGEGRTPITQGPIRSVAANIESPSPARITINTRTSDVAPIGNGKVVGATPDIPAGLKERGVGKNIRTDPNRNPELRSSLTTDPESYKALGNKETLAKAQSIWNEGLETSITQLDDLIKNIQPEAAPLVKMIADELTANGNILRARELLSNAMSRATETGQFGQAFRILRKEADPATLMMTIDKQLAKLNKEGLETYGKKWNDVDLTPDELTKIGKIERGDQASSDEVFDQILARIANEMPATGMEKFIAWRHIAMLLNTTTNIRNVGGNALMMAMRKATQRVEGVLQKATPKAGRTQVVFVDKEYKQLATDYFKVNEKELLSGGNKYRDNITMGMEGKRVFRKSRIGEKFGKDIDVLDKTRKLTYDLLQKGDTPFFRNAYIDRLASYAQAKGIKDFSKLGQEGFDIAKKEALEATYKDMNKVATFLNSIKRPGLDANVFVKGGAVAAEVAFPFIRTPVNLTLRGMAYTPVSLITGLGKMVSKKSAIAGINDMAKGMVGTGIVGLGYMLAGNGILTGKSPKDKDLREYNVATERAPFSIMGKYSFDWALPISIPLIIGVELYNATHESEEEKKKIDSAINGKDDSKLWTAISNTLGGVSNSVEAAGEVTLNMSMLQTLKRLIGNPKGYLEGFKDLPKNLVSQMIPSMLGKFAATGDPLVRTQYVQGDRIASLKNTAIAKIPFASKSLQPKQTPFGENVKKIENIPGRVFSQFFSPGIIAKDQNINPKIDTELRRLNNAEGLKTQFPTMVPNYIEGTQTHPRINLTPTETTKYQKRVGELTLSSFGEVMSSSSYLQTNDNVKKADLLAKAISDAKALAKEEILKSRGIDTGKASSAKVKAYSPFSKSTGSSSTNSPFASQGKDKSSTSPFK